MPRYLHTNNANSNLRDTINAVTNTIRVLAGHGTMFPNPGVDEAFFVTVEDRRAGHLEIMLCTSRSTDTFTVTRGQQGTVPQSFPAGVNVSNRVTATILNAFIDATVGEIPLSRIPDIPDHKLIAVDAARLFGEMNPNVLPIIPPGRLTSVPAENLTGTINAARLPVPIPLANIPTIPDSKISNMAGSKITGTIPVSAVPVIPASKIDPLGFSDIDGTLANAQFVGTYNNIASLVGNGIAYFSRFVTQANTLSGLMMGNAAGDELGYLYSDATTTVLRRRPANVTRAALTITNDGKLTLNPGVYYGDAAGLTNINADGLPTTTAERDRIQGILAAAGSGQIASYMWAKYSGTDIKSFGHTTAGSNLTPTSTTDSGVPRSAVETWMCMGYVDGPGDTLWMRVD